MRMHAAFFILLVIAIGSPMASANDQPTDTKVSEWPPEILEKVNRDRIARENVRRQDPELFAAISNAMFQHDPIGISSTTNTDEYDPETGTVIPRLASCTSADDVAIVLHEEFVKWFGESTAGDRGRYFDLANDIWSLWQNHRPNPSPDCVKTMFLF